jgi:hypothetical protein
MVTEHGKITKRNRVIKMLEGSVKTWSENEWVKHLTDAADSLSSSMAFNLIAEHVECAGQAIPGVPILGKFRKRGLESWNCPIRLVVVFQFPATTKPPVSSITCQRRPTIKQGTTALGFPTVGKSRHEGLARTDVIRVLY